MIENVPRGVLRDRWIFDMEEDTTPQVIHEDRVAATGRLKHRHRELGIQDQWLIPVFGEEDKKNIARSVSTRSSQISKECGWKFTMRSSDDSIVVTRLE